MTEITVTVKIVKYINKSGIFQLHCPVKNQNFIVKQNTI